MLNNLKAEMARYGVSSADIAKAIEKAERSVRDKIKGVYDFTLPEAILVRDKFFPGMSLEYLFEGAIGADSDGAEKGA